MRLRLPVIAASTAALVVGLLASVPASQASDAPRETVPVPAIAPIPTGPIFTGALQDLKERDYFEREYVVTVTNPQVYAYVGDSTDVTVTPAPPSPQGDYRSRIIVRAPVNPADFNGRVLVEMMNTTTTVDLDIAWEHSHDYLMREGWAYVAITVQQTGINALQGFTRAPERYRSLGLNLMTPVAAADAAQGARDPSLAWDLTSQVGALIARGGATSPLKGYGVRATYLTGQSQMAGYAVTYVNAIHPRHRVFDGFLVAYRGIRATNLQYAAPVDGTVPNTSASVAQRRLAGGGTPVINLQTESDPLGFPSGDDSALWRPDANSDTDRFRLWEITGSSHNDRWGAEQALSILERDFGLPFKPACDWVAPSGVNAFPTRFAWNAAIESLAAWHEKGTAPAIGARIERAGGQIVRDAAGNALGGIRLSPVDVPVATRGPISEGGLFCPLTGFQTPFTTSTLKALYPTKVDYARDVRKAAKGDVVAGFLLKADAAELMRLARRGPAKEAQTIREY